MDLSRPAVMGILNVTPDSFYDGGKWTSLEVALRQVEQMLEAGAVFIDIGGMSTKPGSVPVSTDQELQRVLPCIERVHREFPEALISVDTWRAEVAHQAVAAGAVLVNDISGGMQDPALWPLVAKLQIPYILSHIKGTPETMQVNPQYTEGVVLEVLDYFIKHVGALRALGVRDIILDPGFGFGKQLEDNYDLLKHLDTFQMLGLPVLIGISRKSMVYKTIGGTPEDALSGTCALHFAALEKGAKILRVHDVKAAVDVIRVWEMYHGRP